MTIHRGSLTTLWFTLQSSEQLGILDSAYVEDYFGNDGQVSLYHIATNAYYPVVMVEQPAETPVIPHDVFKGSYALALLPDGDYQIRGRVKDVAGNYTILSVVQTPIGGETVQAMTFDIQPGNGMIYTINMGGLILTGGIDTDATLKHPAISGVLDFGLSGVKL